MPVSLNKGYNKRTFLLLDTFCKSGCTFVSYTSEDFEANTSGVLCKNS